MQRNINTINYFKGEVCLSYTCIKKKNNVVIQTNNIFDQININKGLMNPQNKPIKKTNYLTKECKGLMDPKSFKKKEKKELLTVIPYLPSL